MRTLKIVILAALLTTVALASVFDIPLNDTRLTIHTLVREDIFAGFLQNDLDRLSRAEKNIEVLLESRPKERPELLAWKGGAMLYRAVIAHEKNQRAEYEQKYKQALALFAQAQQLAPSRDGVSAVTGGSYVVFADRLPKEHRAAAWEAAYSAYQNLWKQQGAVIDRLPVHLRGEVLGGVAQAAMRTGRTKEAGEMLDKILVVLPGTPYEPIAKQWKANPKAAENSSVTCLTCHEPGRLQDRLTKLNSEPPK
jgi:tetratricopeptide (TPR) repeat protein